LDFRSRPGTHGSLNLAHLAARIVAGASFMGKNIPHDFAWSAARATSFAILMAAILEPRMPIYEYVCDDCSAQFEKIVINRQQEISCPKCSSKKATIQLSVFSSAVAGGSTKSSSGASGGGGACCGGGCGCH
jgi:putative FmdB family regulatory protein